MENFALQLLVKILSIKNKMKRLDTPQSILKNLERNHQKMLNKF